MARTTTLESCQEISNFREALNLAVDVRHGLIRILVSHDAAPPHNFKQLLKAGHIVDVRVSAQYEIVVIMKFKGDAIHFPLKDGKHLLNTFFMLSSHEALDGDQQRLLIKLDVFFGENLTHKAPQLAEKELLHISALRMRNLTNLLNIWSRWRLAHV